VEDISTAAPVPKQGGKPKRRSLLDTLFPTKAEVRRLHCYLPRHCCSLFPSRHPWCSDQSPLISSQKDENESAVKAELEAKNEDARQQEAKEDARKEEKKMAEARKEEAQKEAARKEEARKEEGGKTQAKEEQAQNGEGKPVEDSSSSKMHDSSIPGTGTFPFSSYAIVARASPLPHSLSLMYRLLSSWFL
jgi:hypothetical protein